MLDTPGLISPRLDDPLVSFKMVLVGAVSDEAYDPQEAARVALEWVGRDYPQALAAYARAEEMPAHAAGPDALEALAEARKWLNQGRPDLQRAARTFIHDLQDGALGPMSWDSRTL